MNSDAGSKTVRVTDRCSITITIISAQKRSFEQRGRYNRSIVIVIVFLKTRHIKWNRPTATDWRRHQQMRLRFVCSCERADRITSSRFDVRKTMFCGAVISCSIEVIHPRPMFPHVSASAMSRRRQRGRPLEDDPMLQAESHIMRQASKQQLEPH